MIEGPRQRFDPNSPQAIPDREKKFYESIHNLRKTFYVRLKNAWDRFKVEYEKTIQKALDPYQQALYNHLFADYNSIARDMLLEGVSLGNTYFESQLGVLGLTPEQQQAIAMYQLGVFDQKAQNLFQDDFQTQIENKSPEEQQRVFSTFDRYLMGFANVAVSAAYSVFTKSLSFLNDTLAESVGEAAAIGVPRQNVKVRWVLRETAAHSIDCLVMSQGETQDGSGIWDAKYLAESNLQPTSPLLDCAGNCKCHLSPVGQVSDTVTNFINTLVRIPAIKNSLHVIPNITKQRMIDLLGEKITGIIPAGLTEDIASVDSLHRSEFWKKLKDVNVVVEHGNEFNVHGFTDFYIRGGKTTADNIELRIILGPGDTLETLNALQLRMIREKFEHEIGHIVAHVNEVNGRIVYGSNFLSPIDAENLLGIAGKERLEAMAQISNNFERFIQTVSKTDLQKPAIARQVEIMREFVKNPGDLMLRVYQAVLDDEPFMGRPAIEVARVINQFINQYSVGTKLISGYQLVSEEEYFAEWYKFLLAHPDEAAFYSPALNKAIAQTTPGFFQTAVTRRASTMLPDAVAITLRTDIPISVFYDPIAPNVGTIEDLTGSFKSLTKKLTKEDLDSSVVEALKGSPNLLRTEFFKNLDVEFVDRVSMGTRSGSRSNLGFFEKGVFYVNADIWKSLSTPARQGVLADLVSQHIWNTSAVLRRGVRDSFGEYIGVMLRSLRDKMGVHNLGARGVNELLSFVEASPRNLGLWTRNFDLFKTFLKNVTDLPIMDIDSLRSPEDFLRSWLRIYTVRPELAAYYNRNMIDVIRESLVQ